jgi:hypothetical protein
MELDKEFIEQFKKVSQLEADFNRELDILKTMRKKKGDLNILEKTKIINYTQSKINEPTPQNIN